MQAADVLQAARDRGVMIATAESCTGGLIAGALTEVPGSSDAFDRGFVTYSNGAKQQMLGVTSDTLTEFGAVSEEVAAQMAAGALRNSDAGIAVSVTGIAGPAGRNTSPRAASASASPRPMARAPKPSNSGRSAATAFAPRPWNTRCSCCWTRCAVDQPARMSDIALI